MATNGQFCWPPVGSSVAAYGQFGIAANTQPRRRLLPHPHPRPPRAPQHPARNQHGGPLET